MIKEVRRGNYATVVVGKRGKGGFHDLLVGSVTSKLLNSLESEALWLIP
ncbi:MAG: universal stress protein [Caldimicrobium sp.]|nr:universal stress protein [Caldimicrobium sp.]MDW8094393.1 universal stress protein [Caldimicrobium sp.]